MRSDSKEAVEHHDCPEIVAEQLRLAGGSNIFGEPMFRIIWGYDRIVPIFGKWQEWEPYQATLTDKKTGYSETRNFLRLKSEVIEERQLPKYLPGNCWHLEMWRPPEEYGTREQWEKTGVEHLGLMTISTSGPYPERGEYELCYPLTHDGTSGGQAIPLISEVVTELVRMIVAGRERFSLRQRMAALEQEYNRKENGFVRVTQDRLKDGLRPFAGETFIVKP